MGWEPTVFCRDCGDGLDVYEDYEHQFCMCCADLRAELDRRCKDKMKKEEAA